MVYDNNKKIIFIHIPKTGGTSIENILGLIKKENGYGINNSKKAEQHFIWNDYINILGLKIYNEYYKFSIIRNPYNRLISEYFWSPVCGYIKNQNFNEFLNFVKDVIDNEKYNENIFYDHFIPQYEFIVDNNDKLMVDKLYKFENFNEITNDFKEKYNLNIPHLQKGVYKFKIELSDDQQKFIYELYKKDFEYFGYGA